MTHAEIVIKLVGKISPIGETGADDVRFENLKVLTELIAELLLDVHYVAFSFKDRQEYSVKRACDFANKFLKEVSEEFKIDAQRTEP